MQAIFEEVQKMKTALLASSSAMKQSIALHQVQSQKIVAQATELATLKGEEIAEDAQQAAEQAAVLDSLRACTSALTEMNETVAAATAPEPTPAPEPAEPATATEQTPIA